MTDVTGTVYPVVDIWNYVKELVKENLVGKHIYENNIVEKVYRNDSSTFDHILLPTADENVFVTLVVDIANKTMLGHIKLDLNKKYGLT